jgi:hypothetical protein
MSALIASLFARRASEWQAPTSRRDVMLRKLCFLCAAAGLVVVGVKGAKMRGHSTKLLFEAPTL